MLLAEEVKLIREASMSKAEWAEAMEELQEKAASLDADLAQLTAAAHALHEQAHDGSWLMCERYPCHDLDVERTLGPAPRTVPSGGWRFE